MKDKTTEPAVNTIVLGDCIAGLNGLAEGSVDLVFADPPFNIGYDYDVYRDELESNEYLAWSRAWISAVYRALKPTGTFWLAIGDEYAAELKIESQRIGFFPRSWVIWYYTFGVNCTRKLTRSHVHLHYFVKNRREFTFNEDDLSNRVPSARQLVYNDKRGNPDGRLPDDTWIIRPADAVGELIDDDVVPGRIPPPSDDDHTWTLRPQDLAERFRASEHTWYFPRVAGTFRERAGFHGCQMPEQLLGRIIRLCSDLGSLVVDPFSGSATTLAVAKKLGRRFLGFDISSEYVELGQQRLASVRVGDRLDGAEEPTMSAPQTKAALRAGKRTNRNSRRRGPTDGIADDSQELAARRSTQLEATLRGVVEAFAKAHDGFSADFVVAKKELNQAFVGACRELGLIGDPRTWNILLFRQRKAGRLAHIATTKRRGVTWTDCDRYLFASEIALQEMLDGDLAKSLDEILCDPELADEFDRRANRFVPGLGSFECRWAALMLRKAARTARHRATVLAPPTRLRPPVPIDEITPETTQEKSGVYIVTDIDKRLCRLYIGGTLNLRARLRQQFSAEHRAPWNEMSRTLGLQSFTVDCRPGEVLAWQSCLARKYRPRLNFRELWRAPHEVKDR